MPIIYLLYSFTTLAKVYLLKSAVKQTIVLKIMAINQSIVFKIMNLIRKINKVMFKEQFAILLEK